MLYTLTFAFRRSSYVFQQRAESVVAALDQWVEKLDTHEIKGFGALSRQRLRDNLRQVGPNKAPGLVNVSHWTASISGYVTTIYIVATDESPAG